MTHVCSNYIFAIDNLEWCVHIQKEGDGYGVNARCRRKFDPDDVTIYSTYWSSRRDIGGTDNPANAKKYAEAAHAHHVQLEKSKTQ